MITITGEGLSIAEINAVSRGEKVEITKDRTSSGG